MKSAELWAYKTRCSLTTNALMMVMVIRCLLATSDMHGETTFPQTGFLGSKDIEKLNIFNFNSEGKRVDLVFGRGEGLPSSALGSQAAHRVVHYGMVEVALARLGGIRYDGGITTAKRGLQGCEMRSDDGGLCAYSDEPRWLFG